MSQELLIDMFYAAPELWYLLALAFVVLLVLGFYFSIANLKLRQKNYFLNRDRLRYIETLYASKDGYFAFVYPDDKVNDPRKSVFQRCSRRLAIMLSLSEGTKTKFEDVLKGFCKKSAPRLQKYLDFLRDEGVSFEDEFTTKDNKCYRLYGSRINGLDGSIYCDIIWFKDISEEQSFIKSLEEEKQKLSQNLIKLEDMIDNIPYPVWLRDEDLNLLLINKKYIEFVGAKDKKSAISTKHEILTTTGESASKNLALIASTINKPKKQKVSINKDGKRLTFDVIETPFYSDNNMNKICTVGSLVETTELSDLKRNIKHHHSSHLEILGSLGTAFAVFDASLKLSFHNKAFALLWKLEEVWLESLPTYPMFLDLIRSKRMLPEVPNFSQYKNDETKEFSSILEAKEDLLHLPDGKTFRRLRAPHPMGGLIFAFEDISDRLATRRAYNELLMVRQEILNNLTEAVAIFESDSRLKFYNKSFALLWKNKDSFLKKEPTFLELTETHKKFFDKIADWDNLKKNMFEHITSISTKSFVLSRNDGTDIEVSSNVLSDGSIMVTYNELENKK